MASNQLESCFLKETFQFELNDNYLIFRSENYSSHHQFKLYCKHSY